MDGTPLGDRMVDQYERRTQVYLPRRTYTILRVDGKAFHTLTRGFDRPFDDKFIACMNMTAMYMCQEIQGARLAYVQSDEISLLLVDFQEINTCAWFDGNLQKMVSVGASVATYRFNDMLRSKGLSGVGLFDARVFTIPDPVEVENYFIWRQRDSTRNSIQMVARSLYSHSDLQNKKSDALQEMIFQKGINWNDYPARKKHGACIVKPEGGGLWGMADTPVFTQDRTFLRTYIPLLDGWNEWNQSTNPESQLTSMEPSQSMMVGRDQQRLDIPSTEPNGSSKKLSS